MTSFETVRVAAVQATPVILDARASVESRHGVGDEGRDFFFRLHGGGIEHARDVRQDLSQRGMKLLDMFPLKRGCRSVR